MIQNKKLSGLVAFCFLIVSAICFAYVLRYLWCGQMTGEIEKEVRRIVDNQKVALESDSAEFFHQAWEDLKASNDDFVGYLIFDDGFIEQPVVQGSDNEYYLQHDFYQRWNLFGAIYMDCDNYLNSRNMTLYGHNVFYSEDEMFSPLLKLLDPEQYLRHNHFKLYYENDVAEYRIKAIYYYDINKDRDFDYRQQDFSQEEFTDYINYVNERNLINSDLGSETEPDRILTIQTCKDLYGTVRVLFLCVEEDRTEYK